MKTNLEFVAFVMTHAKNKYPNGVYYATAAIGADRWEYLFGCTGEVVTQALLDERWKNHYSKKMSIEQYKIYTKGWIDRGTHAVDCQGLLDCFVGKNVTADYCYRSWCSEKGIIETNIPFLSTSNAAGCAVFAPNEDGSKMTHVGFIIGRDSDGVPLVGEARGIAYGVTVTRLTDRGFTHWGRPSKVLEFPVANIIPAVMPLSSIKTDPANTPRIIALQIALVSNGYPVAIDGKMGTETRTALTAFIAANTPESKTEMTVTRTGTNINVDINGNIVYHEIL